MADVFISYKSERRPAVSHLARVIENYGYTVWFDYALMSGPDFSLQIERELRAARAVIVVWCSLSVQRSATKTNWVLEEAYLARQLNTYLPVWIEPVELPFGFKMGETTDLSVWDCNPRSDGLDRLLEQLSHYVKREPMPNYRALVSQSAEVKRSGISSLITYPLDKRGAAQTARKREAGAHEQEQAAREAERQRQLEIEQSAIAKRLAEEEARREYARQDAERRAAEQRELERAAAVAKQREDEEKRLEHERKQRAARAAALAEQRRARSEERKTL